MWFQSVAAGGRPDGLMACHETIRNFRILALYTTLHSEIGICQGYLGIELKFSKIVLSHLSGITIKNRRLETWRSSM
jgi:hypothetical protein